ncbi:MULTISPECIES: hypothetical protein [unclassified Streptomyces]
MAGLIGRLKAFARSPQGRRAIEEARRAAADPRRRAQAQGFLARLKRRR